MSIIQDRHVCKNGSKIIQIFSKVVVHEMGHNMGMQHDFNDVHGGEGGPCDGTGFMSYGGAPHQWSTCSKADFFALYNAIVDSGNLYWCLDCK